MANAHNPSRRALFAPALAVSIGAALPLAGDPLSAQEPSRAGEPSLLGIMQIAYVVQDLRAAIKDWVERLGVGPWSITDHFRPQNPVYRGQPTNVDITIAMSYSGATNIELIQQLNDAPSVYLDGIKKHGYGFHHWGLGTLSYERDLERFRSGGDVLAFSCTAPRLTYIETSSSLPGYVELIEVNDGIRSAFGAMYRRSRDWDRKEAIVR